MKLTTALENFKGVVSDDLSFASVEIDKNCWLTLPRWKSLCHRLSRDQPQPGSFFQRPREAEKRDPGNEVGADHELRHHVSSGACNSLKAISGQTSGINSVAIVFRNRQNVAITIFCCEALIYHPVFLSGT